MVMGTDNSGIAERFLCTCHLLEDNFGNQTVHFIRK